MHTDGIRPGSPVKRTIAAAPSEEFVSTEDDELTAWTTVLAEGPVVQKAWRDAEEMSKEQASLERNIPFAHPASHWKNACNRVGIRKEMLDEHFKKSGLIMSPSYDIPGDIEVWIKAVSQSFNEISPVLCLWLTIATETCTTRLEARHSDCSCHKRSQCSKAPEDS